MTEARTEADVTRAISRVTKAITPQLDRVLTCSKGGTELITRLQSLVKTQHLDMLDRAVHETVLTHAIASEKMGPGSLSLFLDLVSDDEVKASSGHVLGRHPTVDDVKRVVARRSSTARPFVGAMIWEALNLAGFGGRIIVEKTSSSVPSVELVRGYTFEVNPGFPLDFSFLRPRVACIDGFIESVSEVHHLLEAAAAAREPCVCFMRGASHDVIHTLRVNYDRGTLRVVPMIVRFDLDGMNTLNDIAIVAGTDVVSALKGELISSVNFSQLAVVEQVTAFKGSTVIVEGKTASSVRVHVGRLRNRREEERVDDVGRLLDARIRSLSPSHVVVRLPDDRDFVVNSQAIDNTLRSVRACIDRGVDESGDPVATVVAARYHAMRCRDTLKSLGAALV